MAGLARVRAEGVVDDLAVVRVCLVGCGIVARVLFLDEAMHYCHFDGIAISRCGIAARSDATRARSISDE